jgi:hypothetical protein
VAHYGAPPLRIRKFGREVGGIAHVLEQLTTAIT